MSRCISGVFGDGAGDVRGVDQSMLVYASDDARLQLSTALH